MGSITEKRIGLALGGGSVRGLAHIGVLKVFDEEKIPVSFISGTSIGAIIGAAYCSGLKAIEIEKIFLTTDYKALMDFKIPKRGLLAGRKIEKMMNKITREKTFEELLIPLAVVTTDLQKSEKVVLTKGNVARAIRASIAIPPFFTPVIVDNHELVDGGLVDPVPVSVLHDMKAEKIIAVDISHDIKVEYANKKNGPQKSTFAHVFYESFIKTEYHLAREIFRKKKFRYLPSFIKSLLIQFFDMFFNPKRIIAMISGREPPQIFMMMVQEIAILTNELTVEKLKASCVDVVVKPDFKDITVFEFDRVEEIIKKGEDAARKALPDIRKLLLEEKPVKSKCS
jgi:NTE family protein